MANSLKRKAFSIDYKVKIVKCIEDGTNESAQSKEFSLTKSTISNIWKNRSAILAAYNKNMVPSKKLCQAERENVEEDLLKWFTTQKHRNFSVTGPMHQIKANEFAEKLEEKDFVCSNGWQHRFKEQNNISSGKIIGEASVDATDVEN
ncbi:tigger transposable element-derived protein 4-like [Parasteatoda tepidariorum]|uniref:tigger transposable element-derived protein 4-like n=1 Tax=Parasteatoda tepidariorum TaxID=114398 RepID=UPI0039BD422E